MAKAFRAGQRFKFPNDEAVYTFVSIWFKNGKPVIKYEDSEGKELDAHGFDLFDLIHV